MPRHADLVGRYMYLTVDGMEYRIYYEEAGTGVPVMLQHTAGSDGRQWRHLLEDPELTREFRFIAHDLPFHGKSLPPEGRQWWAERYELHQDFFMNFIVTLSHELELLDPIYVGCSMGGHLAPDLALFYPGEFRGVVAVEGGLATHDLETFRDYMWHPRASDEMKAALMYGMMSPKSPEKYRRETAWLYAQGGPPVHLGDLTYYTVEHDLTESAKDIDTSKTAVYVLGGDYDWSADPPHCKALADAIPGAIYVKMNDLGHFPMSEDPESFKRYLAPVLREMAQIAPA